MFLNKDLLFLFSDYLNDQYAINMFRSNKYVSELFRKNPQSYTVKKLIDYNLIDKYQKYKISRIFNFNNSSFQDLETYKIKEISFSDNFDYPVDDLPNYITHIDFGYDFNQKVHNLPSNLQELRFGYNFNQSVDNLSKNITYLEFGYKFNQYVDNLSDNITHLKFGHDFNQ
jgi:hypothetical protein